VEVKDDEITGIKQMLASCLARCLCNGHREFYALVEVFHLKVGTMRCPRPRYGGRAHIRQGMKLSWKI
jgi:hypothetical protein